MYKFTHFLYLFLTRPSPTLKFYLLRLTFIIDKTPHVECFNCTDIFFPTLLHLLIYSILFLPSTDKHNIHKTMHNVIDMG